MQRKNKQGKEHWRVLLATALPLLVLLLSVVGLALPARTEPLTPSATEPPLTVAATLPPTEPTASVAVPSVDDPLLLLVNASHPLTEEYAPELTRLQDWDLSVATVCYDDLKAMLAAGRAQGLSFQIASAYRTREEQKNLFDEDVKARMDDGMSEAEAKAETAHYTMEAGCSEHETGLALDIVAMSNQLLDETQEQTGETRWLHVHAWEYGFILRYPKDKEDITGVSYEAWHYRYVGKEAAAYLTENNLTLEEYLGG